MKNAPAVSFAAMPSADVERPILVFDSGIGGLTVLREARVLMPDRRFVYVADDAGFPYGGWEEDALRERIVELFGKLIAAYDPEIAVIACNTASTLVLDDLRQAYPSVPFVGTVPAIKPAAERTSSGLVSVLATPGTVRRAYTRDLIQSFATQCHVRLVGADQLATVAEAHIRGEKIDEALIVEQIAPASLSRMVTGPTLSCWPARTIRSLPMCFAVLRHGRLTGSILRKRSPGVPSRC